MSDTLGTKAFVEVKKMTDNFKIKGQVILSQAEYNALPASKLTDGKLYLIKE